MVPAFSSRVRQPRRKRRDPEASRRRLETAGERLFAERGYDGVTVAMISREARLNRRMLYHYFGNKEGLYRAVIGRAYERLAEMESDLAGTAAPVEELVEGIIRAYYGFLDAHPEIVRLLTWENLRQGRTARTLDIASAKTPILEALREAMSQGKREGRFRGSVDERQLLVSCMALSFFYFSNRYTLSQSVGVDFAGEGATEKRIRHVVRLVLDGIRAGNGGELEVGS